MLVIASFTPDDVRRTELKVAWSRNKSYFTVNGGRLELQNVPVPGRPGAPVPIPIAAHLLGWSALADLVADRLSIFAGWYYDEVQGAPRGSGPEISCLLMQRLAKLDVPVIVLAEYSRGHWTADAEGKARDFAMTGPVLACAEKAGLIPLDMAKALKPVMAEAWHRRDVPLRPSLGRGKSSDGRGNRHRRSPPAAWRPAQAGNR